MSSSVQSGVSSQGPTSPKKKYQQTEGKGSLEESIHNVKHLDLNMARSNHSVDFSTLDNSDGSEEEMVEVDEETTGWEEENDLEKSDSKRIDNPDNDNDDASYEEEVLEDEEEVIEDALYEEEVIEEVIYDLDDDEEMEDTAPSSAPVDEEDATEPIQHMTHDDDTAKDQPVPMVVAQQPSSAPVDEEVAVEPIQHMILDNNTAKHQPIPMVVVAQPSSYQQNIPEANENKNLSWKKPSWTKTTVLKKTAKGQVVKAGGTVSAPITNIASVAAEKKDLSFKKPDWTKNTKLRSTGKGEVLMSEGNLAKPITSLPHMGKEFDKHEPTMIEKSHISPNTKQYADDDNNVNEGEDKKIGWEKPDWAKSSVLKGTAKGDKLKSGGTLSLPIGGIKQVD
jgi:hypothetical protein